MEKGIIVIENPKSCIECPMCYHSENMSIGGNKFEKLYRCKIEPEGLEDPYLKDVIHEKPEWCPIKPIPKEKPSYMSMCLNTKECLKNRGFNECLNEILKG